MSKNTHTHTHTHTHFLSFHTHTHTQNSYLLRSFFPPVSDVQGWEGKYNEDTLAVLIDEHVLKDKSGIVGSVICELGNTYLHAGVNTLLFKTKNV